MKVHVVNDKEGSNKLLNRGILWTYQNDLIVILLHENVHLLVLEKIDRGRWILTSIQI